MQDRSHRFRRPQRSRQPETDIAIELRNRDRERKLIKKIEETLVALKAAIMASASKCGVEIGIKRLEARPTATFVH